MRRAAPLLIALGMLLLVVGGLGLAGDRPPVAAQEDALRARLEALGITPLSPPPEFPPALVELGQALFFDKLLSGNRDIACATCHHPLLATGDGRSLPLGTGQTGLGPARVHAPGRMFIARNAPDLFNRGDPAWRVMFWDGRVLVRGDGTTVTPAKDALPAGLDGLLAVQALFPVAAIEEMRGLAGDVDVLGQENELALYDEYDFTGIWAALMARVRAVPGYVDLLAAAYPDVRPEDYAIQHVANALAAFQASAFAFTDSPWQRYLHGEDGALSEQARTGATLFFGEAGCWRCHSGPLLTDQRFHNVAAPQLGTGKREEAPHDFGRGRVTHDPAERYAFRTPSLHEVTLTGPWFHNGAYTTLEAAVRHMIAPVESLRAYDGAGLIAELRANLWDDPDTLAAVLSTLDPLAGSPVPLAEADVDLLLAFLETLADPAAADLAHLIPESVPSGLPVED